MIMNFIKKIFKFLRYLNWKTIAFNYMYFDLRTASKFPVCISRNVVLKKLKGKVIIEGDIYFGKITIGGGYVGVFDAKRSKSIWEVSGEVTFKGTAQIGHGSKISCGPDGRIEFGDKFSISAESTIVSQKNVVFGENCLLSWDILILDSDFHQIYKNGVLINNPTSIQIGNNVWIGCRSTILKGTVLPDGAIIAAGAICSKDYSNDGGDSILAGVPARVVSQGVVWKE